MGTCAFEIVGGTRAFATPNGTVDAFRDVNLTVETGEIRALIGPSGCGKSTLLNVVAGLDVLTSGTYTIGGDAAAGSAVGIVFQDAHLLPWLTVEQNVALGLKYRANRQIAASDVAPLLEVVGLSHLSDALPHELSGGQAQRVAIARTALTRPALLLLDEPFAALDPLTRRGLQDWLRDIRDVFGFTVVFVTHDVDEAVHIADRVTLMRGGTQGVLDTYDTHTLRRGTDELANLREVLLDRYAAHDRDISHALSDLNVAGVSY